MLYPIELRPHDSPQRRLAVASPLYCGSGSDLRKGLERRRLLAVHGSLEGLAANFDLALFASKQSRPGWSIARAEPKRSLLRVNIPTPARALPKRRTNRVITGC
jgi:hypothetical protein